MNTIERKATMGCFIRGSGQKFVKRFEKETFKKQNGQTDEHASLHRTRYVNQMDKKNC